MIGNTPVADPGEGPGGGGGAGLPLFLDQTEARRAEKNFGGHRSSPKGLDDPPPLISRSGSGTAHGFVLPIREGYYMLVTRT